MLITTNDLNLIHKLDSLIFLGKSYTKNTYLQMQNTSFFYIIQIQNQPIGFIVFSKSDQDLELLKIGVLKSHQNKGFAKQALKIAIKTLEYQNIFLEVSNLNSIAIKLYQSLGFVVINNRLHYYGDNNHALIMKLTKPQS